MNLQDLIANHPGRQQRKRAALRAMTPIKTAGGQTLTRKQRRLLARAAARAYGKQEKP